MQELRAFMPESVLAEQHSAEEDTEGFTGCTTTPQGTPQGHKSGDTVTSQSMTMESNIHRAHQADLTLCLQSKPISVLRANIYISQFPRTYEIFHKKIHLHMPGFPLSPLFPFLMVKGVKLRPWERSLLDDGLLSDVTHTGSSSVWLDAPSSVPAAGDTVLYRPMGDLELEYLLAHGALPSTQPYQAVIEAAAGRVYAEKYLNGKKWVDSAPTTVVEFTIPASVVTTLMAIQCKPEDGAMSMGLGSKAGGGLPIFNKALAESGSYRIVKVKRTAPKKK